MWIWTRGISLSRLGRSGEPGLLLHPVQQSSCQALLSTSLGSKHSASQERSVDSHACEVNLDFSEYLRAELEAGLRDAACPKTQFWTGSVPFGRGQRSVAGASAEDSANFPLFTWASQALGEGGLHLCKCRLVGKGLESCTVKNWRSTCCSLLVEAQDRQSPPESAGVEGALWFRLL